MKVLCLAICLLYILSIIQTPVKGKAALTSTDDDSSSKEYKDELSDNLAAFKSEEKKDIDDYEKFLEKLEPFKKQDKTDSSEKVFDWATNHMINFWEKVKEQEQYTKWLKSFMERNRCGKQIIEPVWPNFRIVGGRSVIPGSWPWMASLLFNLFDQHWCAGTLISDQWLVTARHCFSVPLNDTRDWSVRLGKFDLSQEEGEEQQFTIKKFIGHPGYNPENFNNDLALIQLDRPAELSEFVSPICLRSQTPAASTSNDCIITGWGKTTENSTQLSSLMRQVEVPLMKQSECTALYPGKVTRKMLCAGLYRGGQDACAGDSGGPLQCRIRDTWYLQGITSWGGANYVECGRAFQPGVYTKVSLYKKWIYKQIYYSQFDANRK